MLDIFVNIHLVVLSYLSFVIVCQDVSIRLLSGIKQGRIGSGKAGTRFSSLSTIFILTHARLGEQIDALKGTCATIRT